MSSNNHRGRKETTIKVAKTTDTVERGPRDGRRQTPSLESDIRDRLDNRLVELTKELKSLESIGVLHLIGAGTGFELTEAGKPALKRALLKDSIQRRRDLENEIARRDVCGNCGRSWTE